MQHNSSDGAYQLIIPFLFLMNRYINVFFLKIFPALNSGVEKPTQRHIYTVHYKMPVVRRTETHGEIFSRYLRLDLSFLHFFWLSHCFSFPFSSVFSFYLLHFLFSCHAFMCLLSLIIIIIIVSEYIFLVSACFVG